MKQIDGAFFSMTRSILRSDAIFDILEEGFFWKSLFVLEERLSASFIFRPVYLDTSVSLFYFCFAFLIAVSRLLLINARTLHAKKKQLKVGSRGTKAVFLRALLACHEDRRWSLSVSGIGEKTILTFQLKRHKQQHRKCN